MLQLLTRLRAQQCNAIEQLLGFTTTPAYPGDRLDAMESGHTLTEGMHISVGRGRWPLIKPLHDSADVRALCHAFNASMEACTRLSGSEAVEAQVAELELGAAKVLFAWVASVWSSHADRQQDVASLVAMWDELLAAHPESFLEQSKSIPGPLTLYDWCSNYQARWRGRVP